MQSIAQAIAEWEQKQEHAQALKPLVTGRRKWLCSCDNCRYQRRQDKLRAKQDRHVKGFSRYLI